MPQYTQMLVKKLMHKEDILTQVFVQKIQFKVCIPPGSNEQLETKG
jgi:hypothetical protein